jgi:chromosome partition protein MukE
MDQKAFSDIGAAVLDEQFPEVDLALRRGRHIDREDAPWYGFLLEAQAVLEPFYRRFGCELIHKSDGYFYLLPVNDKLGRRQLTSSEMLVGQALALLYLDPSTVRSGGLVTRQDVLGHMAQVMGTDGLMGAFNPKKKRLDERVAQETVRTRVAEGLRKLAAGGFVEALEGDSYRLRSALMRFAEPVRSSDSPAEALRKLVEKGEAVLTDKSEDDAEDEATREEHGDETEGNDDLGEAVRSDGDGDVYEDAYDDEEPEEDASDDEGPEENAHDDEESEEATSDDAERSENDAADALEEKIEALNAEFDDLFDDEFSPDSEPR